MKRTVSVSIRALIEDAAGEVALVQTCAGKSVSKNGSIPEAAFQFIAVKRATLLILEERERLAPDSVFSVEVEANLP